MTELSFLIDLLLNHKLPSSVRQLVSARIREVEATLSVSANVRLHQQSPLPSQQPSTLALMAKHGDIPPVQMPAIPQTAPAIPEQIAQTPAAAQALAARNAAINEAISGKIPKGQEKARKW